MLLTSSVLYAIIAASGSSMAAVMRRSCRRERDDTLIYSIISERKTVKVISKKESRITALIMLICAIVFIVFAVTHPESSFPWNNAVTYSIYAVYTLTMLILFIAPFKRK